MQIEEAKVAIRIITGIVAAMLLVSPAWAQHPALQSEPVAAGDDGRGTPFIVDKTDSICGIDEPRAITSPASIDYEAVLEVTEEVKLLKRRRIDPESAKGIKLMTDARHKVLAACEGVRSDAMYCSIWKKIKRRDKTPIDDVTEKVKAKLVEDDQE